jgi:hypothetical protein
MLAIAAIARRAGSGMVVPMVVRPGVGSPGRVFRFPSQPRLQGGCLLTDQDLVKAAELGSPLHDLVAACACESAKGPPGPPSHRNFLLIMMLRLVDLWVDLVHRGPPFGLRFTDRSV